LDKLDLKAFSSNAIPRSFIHCRQDKALPQGYFHRDHGAAPLEGFAKTVEPLATHAEGSGIAEWFFVLFDAVERAGQKAPQVIEELVQQRCPLSRA